MSHHLTCNDPVCSFCGEEIRPQALSGGQWNGSGVHFEMYCCGRCAVDVLPRWMADSIHVMPARPGGGGEYRSAHQALPKILTNFWMALCARASLPKRTPIE